MIQTITNTVMPIANITFYHLIVLTSQKQLFYRPYVFFVFCKLFQSRQVSQFLAGSGVKKHDCDIPMCAQSVSRVYHSLFATRNIVQRPLSAAQDVLCLCLLSREQNCATTNVRFLCAPLSSSKNETCGVKRPSGASASGLGLLPVWTWQDRLVPATCRQVPLLPIFINFIVVIVVIMVIYFIDLHYLGLV